LLKLLASLAISSFLTATIRTYVLGEQIQLHGLAESQAVKLVAEGRFVVHGEQGAAFTSLALVFDCSA